MTDYLPQPNAESEPADQWDAIARFLAGESSAAQAAQLRQWLIEYPDYADTVAALDAMLPAASHGMLDTSATFTDPVTLVSTVEVERALRSVHALIKTSAPTLQLSKSAAQIAIPPRTLHNRTAAQLAISATTSGKRFGGWQIAGIAAAAAVLGVFGFNQWRSPRVPASTVAVTYESKVGVQDSILLPDSSRVVLAPGSRLIVAANYGQTARSVELQGDGQFTVKHDAKRPFSVHVGTALITDLGTIFLVKSSAESGVKVSVMEGSVSLGSASPDASGQPLELKAGDRGQLPVTGNPIAQLGAVTPDEGAWLTGKLKYVDASLSEVQADLRRWYGVELVVSDSVLARQTITADALASEPVEKLLDKIAIMKGATAVRHGDSAFIARSGDRTKH